MEDVPDGDLKEKYFNPEPYKFISHIFMAKARGKHLMTGLAIARSELSGLLLCMRLKLRAVSFYTKRIQFSFLFD